MGRINPERILTFKSTQSLFSRIKKRLASFNALGLFDVEDFHKHVKYIIEALGQGVYTECEAIIPVCDYKGKLPGNFKTLYSMYKCNPYEGQVKSINEQRPVIYYVDTEFSKECGNKCGHDLLGPEANPKMKVVYRTYVEGDAPTCNYTWPRLLKLSPNVRPLCDSECKNQFCVGADEVTIDDDGVIHTMFTGDSIYMQYFGLPLDEKGLPKIPDVEDIEKAVEYYIYTQVFEDMRWNGVPNIERHEADAYAKYQLHFKQALYWAKLPSFQRCLQSIRQQRQRLKFYYFAGDKTIIAET